MNRETQGVAVLRRHSHLRNPEPEVAGETEVRNTHACQRTRIPVRGERGLLPEQQLEMRPLHGCNRASQPQHRKSAIARCRLLAAEEIDAWRKELELDQADDIFPPGYGSDINEDDT